MVKYSGPEPSGWFRFCPRQMRFLVLTVILTVTILVVITRGPHVVKSNDLPLLMTSEVRSQLLNVQRSNPEENASPTLGKNNSTSVFLCIDSAQLTGTTDISSTLKKFANDDSLLRSCNADSKCTVYLIVYDDDKATSGDEIRKSIKEIFVHDVNKTTSNIYSIPQRKDDARKISDIIEEAYIRGEDYFYFLTSVYLNSGGAAGRNIENLMKHLHISPPHDTGVVLLDNPDKSKLNAPAAGFFISRIHIEIFGGLFPYQIASLSAGLQFISSVYSREKTQRLSRDSITPYTVDSVAADSSEVPAALLEEERAVLQGYLKAVSASNNCLRCNVKSSKKIIAMSLYGTSPRYTMGALRNAQLLPVVFPGWRLWFYTEKDPATGARRTNPPPVDIVARIEELGSELRYIDTSITGLAPMLWRFTVAEETDVESFIIRDCDARLTLRDAAVVTEWLKTDKAFHCIRDHPSHSNYAVSGGLWGGRPSKLREIFNGSLATVMKRYGAGYVEDMHFLGRDVWPKVMNNHAICHDSYSCERYPSSVRFPVARIGQEHLGQVYDEHSIGRQGDMDIIKNHGVNTKCVPS